MEAVLEATTNPSGLQAFSEQDPQNKRTLGTREPWEQESSETK